MLRLTPVVRNIIIINVIVFIFQNIMPVQAEYLPLHYIGSDDFRPYQLFSYMFAHGGMMHIFFNMLTLAFVGPILETYWGQNKFLTFYLFTGIGAGVFNLLINFFLVHVSAGSMLGASGAIYGVLMGFGMQFPEMTVQLLIPPIPVKAKYLVFLLGGMTFLMDRSGQVAHYAHLGGVVFAFILMTIWRRQGGGY